MTAEARPVVAAGDHPSLDDAFRAALAAGAHLAVTAADVAVPPGWPERAGALLDGDMGIASVALVDRPTLEQLEATGGSEGSASRGLGKAAVRAALAEAAVPPLSVAVAGGPAVVLGHGALTRVPDAPAAPSVGERLAAWSTEVGRRAFVHLLVVDDLVDRLPTDGATDEEVAPAARLSVAGAVDVATRMRVALRGLRVHVDGRTFEGAETGTEVHTLNLIRALAARPEIAYVGVNVRAGLPPYAEGLRSLANVNVVEGCGEWRADLPIVDVFHRPYQPLSPDDCALWRAMAARTACHMQDLITYLSPEYHASVEAWQGWRAQVGAAVTSVDGVFTLSEHVRHQLLREGLRGEPELVWSAGCGVDHVAVSGPAHPPPELADHEGRRFALVLGSTYGHKNADLAAAAVAEVRERGHDLLTVTAGRVVEADSSGVTASGAGTVAIGRNVSSAERDWLLANAAVVVFATSAEGFGLVPFEAAAFGTPTVCVDFGSLAEHLGPLPVTAPDWSVAAFAAAVEAVIADPAAARAQVAAVRQAATRHTWDGTASVVLRGYRAIVARPARR